MRIALGADDDDALVDHVEELLRANGHTTQRLPVAAWGRVGLLAASLVAGGVVDQAVVLCFTGTGVAMAANKVPGVRAALCIDAATAAGARRWNDANVLALSLRLTTRTMATEIMEAWLGTVYAGTEDESLAAVAKPPLVPT